MIFHPWMVALLAIDVTTLVLLASASVTALRVVVGWSPGSASRGQIELERLAEAGSLQARWVLVLVVLASVATIVAIVHLLPPVVPGAMCGTGVMQAAGRAGTRALVMQAIALSTMAGWGVVDHLGRGSPTGEATPLSSRVLLFSTPAPALAAWSRLQVWMAVDTEQPVDCCAALYDAAAGPSGGAPASQGHGLVPTAAAITLMVLVAAAWNVYRPRAGSRHAGPLLLAFSAALWVTLAGLVLVHTLAPYHYGVLHHYCPFCFFLPEHRAVGWPLLVSLVVVGIGGQSALVASLTASRVRSLDRVARRGIRMAGIAVLAATILFLVVAVLPVLAWRVRTGVWIDG